MKSFFAFLLCCFTTQFANAQAEIFALKITNYKVDLSDSIKIVQVVLPDGCSIEKDAVGLVKANFNNSKNTDSIGWGRCSLIKGDYYYFGLHLYNKNRLPQNEDLVYTKVNYPAIFKGYFYNLTKRGIFFKRVVGDDFYDFATALNLTQQIENNLLDSMVVDIKYTGKVLTEQSDNQNMKIVGGIYDGKNLFATMQNIKRDDLIKFLKYVLAKPAIYAGNTWKISETFATWMTNETPTVIEK
jgi:hypothetical protein